MENENEIERGAVHPLWQILFEQTRSLDELLHRVWGPDVTPHIAWNSDVLRVAPLMVQALGISVHSILRLTETPGLSVRDAYGVARSAAELAVNICFITVAGSDAATKAERHAFQKRYRDMRRSRTIGGVTVDIERADYPEASAVPGLEDALAEFSDKKGRELPDWTKSNISERIDAVRAVHPGAAISLTVSITSVYRHSSDILHGTYSGVEFFWTGSRGIAPTTREAFAELWEEHMQVVFSGAFFATSAVIELFAKIFEIPGLAEANDELTARLTKYAEGQSASSPSGPYSASVQLQK